ncbi:MAG: Gfo/Idh/MocA family protein [Limisphaerales bacterium]
MPDAKYRVAVIGDTKRGRYGHGLDTCWLAMPEAEIVGVSDPDPAGRAAAGKRLRTKNLFSDYRELLDQTKPQIAAICPRWLDQHREMFFACAQRGIHMFMEKPMCPDLEQADEMIAAAEKHDVKLAMAHQTRYSPRLDAVRKLIPDGAIGKVLELQARGKEDSRRGGGEDLWVLGSHMMNLIHTLGGEPDSCFATVKQGGQRVTREHVKPGNEGIGPLAGDNIFAQYEMADGVMATFGSQRAVGGRPSRFGLQIYGSKGIIEILSGYMPEVWILQDVAWSPGRSKKEWLPVSSAGINQPEPLQMKDPRTTGNVHICRDLIAAINDDRDPECSIHEGRWTVEMIAAIFESHRLNAPVTFPLKERRNPLSLL